MSAPERDASLSLPMEDQVLAGIEILAGGQGAAEENTQALLVAIARPKLIALGYDIPRTIPTPKARLYAILEREYGDGAHSKYNALMRRLVSFSRAKACVSGQARSIFAAS